MNRRRSRLALASAAIGLLLGPLAAGGAPAAQGSTPAAASQQTAALEHPALRAHSVRRSTVGEPGETEPEEPVPTIPSDPLRVVIREVSPSVLPRRGPLVVSGQVRNRSTTDWTELRVYLLTSFAPLTTPSELDAAVQSDPRTEFGDRLISPGLYTDVPDLAPGESTTFRLSVPAGQLQVSGAPGVYWLGVQVLGTTEGGRLEGADGRARTFLPLVPAGHPGTELALGLQIRRRTVHAEDGSLRGLSRWGAMLDGGRLDQLLTLSATADDWPLSWVVDPAVVDAVRWIAEENPPLTLGGGAEVEARPGANDEAPGDGDDPGAEEGGAELSAEALAAREWLERFTAVAQDRSVLRLPYGDLDVSASVRHGAASLVSTAFAASAERLGDAVGSAPILLPPDGYLSPPALAALEPSVPVVLGPGAVQAPEGGPAFERAGGGRILVSPTRIAVLGPGPTGERTALGVRQRLLADAALHALSPGRDEPLVRFLPPTWHPGRNWGEAEFFAGLDVPWLSGRAVDDVLHGPVSTAEVDPAVDVSYPAAAEREELPPRTLLAASRLIGAAGTLEELLTGEVNVDDALTHRALAASSLWNRNRPLLAAVRAATMLRTVQSWLGGITVRGPSFVTMSSETGTFQVTVVNRLDHPVTVGLRTTVSDGGLTLSSPGLLRLQAEGRGAVRIDATATDIGVHQVLLQPVSEAGTPLGEPARLSIRSSRVGLILWMVMAAGGAILLVAIVVRIRRRISRRRRTHGPVLKRTRA